MTNTTAILSLLHQPQNAPNSATRLFRAAPVLLWTLRRLSQCRGIAHRAVLCWEDQLDDVRPVAAACGAFVLAKGPRGGTPMVDAVSVACNWSDGWRGGLLGTCCFDRGFHASWMNEIRQQLAAEAVVLIDPDAGLVDPVLVDGLIDHARQRPHIEYCFSPAAPGLSGVLLRPALLDRFASLGGYPGRQLTYWPDVPGRDPISHDTCAAVPTCVARTTHRFTLDTDRQLRRMERATIHLNGSLIASEAETLVNAVNRLQDNDPLPRDITLEINTTRAARPIYRPGSDASVTRPGLSPDLALKLFKELAAFDDIRLTLAGLGDPPLSPRFFDIISAARDAGIASIHIETDLLGIDAPALSKLAETPIDIISVHIPALTPATYHKMMGVDALSTVIANLRQLLAHRQSLSRGLPIVVPTFVKCRENLHEMEPWYDQWLRAVGSAVIAAPSDCAGQISDVSVADMSPPRRRPCQRLNSRLTILSDGQVAACEQDFVPLHSVGNIASDSLQDVWQTRLATLRRDHLACRWDTHPLCKSCREWHRP